MRISRKGTLRWLTVLLMVTALATIQRQIWAQDHLPFACAPYLQFATTNSIYVVWRTEGPILPVVRFGPKRDALAEVVPPAQIVVRAALGSETQTVPAKWEG